jgi:hypothetical protein
LRRLEVRMSSVRDICRFSADGLTAPELEALASSGVVEGTLVSGPPRSVLAFEVDVSDEDRWSDGASVESAREAVG